MIVAASQALVVVAGVWLIGLGIFMLLRPRLALAALGRMGSSRTIHIGEMTIRILAGLALVFSSSASRNPLAFAVIGGFLIASALVLLALPRRWHAAYSTWWSRRIPIAAVRLIGPVSWVMGGLLIWTVT